VALVSLPLESVIKNLPDRLKAAIAAVPSADAKIAFPAARLLPQVAKGSVKVKFSELMAAAPTGIFTPLPGTEEEPIELPLGDVIARLGAGAFKRKTAKQAPALEPQDFFGANRGTATPSPAAVPPAPEQAPAPAPAPAPLPAAVFAPAVPTQSFAPATPAPPPDAPVTPPSPPAAAPTPGMAAISLSAVMKALPADLQDIAQTVPAADATAELPIDLLLPQLAKGRITISLSALAKASPPGLFKVLPGNEETPVPLPLGEVLAKVGPGALKRKAPTKELTGLEEQNFFGGQSALAATPPPAQEPQPPAAATPIPSFAPAFQPTTPTPDIAPTFPPATPAPVAPPPEPEAPKPSLQFVPTAPEQPTAAPPTEVPGGAGDTAGTTEVLIPLTKLDSMWPAALKSELAHLDPASVVVFPAEELGHSMKTGKVRFTWAQIRRWLKPKTNFGGTSWENTELDIPLKAIVGPFMAAMRGQPQAVKAPAENESAPATRSAKVPPTAALYVPPSFTPASGSAPEPAATPFFKPTGAPTTIPGQPGISGIPRPMDGPVEMPAPAEPPTPSQLGAILGKPGKDHWTPVEIVQSITEQRETSGAMISLAEGQIAASQLAGNVNAELLAFRVPRLFSTTADQVRELLDQSMSYFSFSAEGVQWIVFKLGNIFFTVQGTAGESLPVIKLQSVAVEIGRQRR
jgi:hypothetical protein